MGEAFLPFAFTSLFNGKKLSIKRISPRKADIMSRHLLGIVQESKEEAIKFAFLRNSWWENLEVNPYTLTWSITPAMPKKVITT